jgi:hypothetical protein
MHQLLKDVPFHLSSCFVHTCTIAQFSRILDFLGIPVSSISKTDLHDITETFPDFILQPFSNFSCLIVEVNTFGI